MEDLPVEIMQNIFFEICSPRTGFPLRRDEPRLLVTHVCSRWRAIALSTPTLWASFYIRPARVDPVPYANILRTWISRAAQSALSLRSHDPYPRLDVSITCSMIVELIFPVIHRCSFLHLYLDIATMHQLLTLPPNSLHALQSLTIRVRGRAQMVDPTPFSTALSSCPQLHAFALVTPRYLEYPPMNLKIANFNLPWHQLTTLTLASPSISACECLDIIRRCTSLQRCIIERLPPIDDLARDRIMELSHPPTTLPSLHTLRAGFAEYGLEENHRAFFQALRLPHLRNFRPVAHSCSLFWSLPIFQPALCDTIRELDLSGFPFPENLAETLVLVPNLEILWLGRDAHEHPRRMTCDFGDSTVAPRLATLYFEFVENLRLPLDILQARAAAARADHDIADLSIILLDPENMDTNPSDEARLTALAESGIHIRLGVTDSTRHIKITQKRCLPSTSLRSLSVFAPGDPDGPIGV